MRDPHVRHEGPRRPSARFVKPRSGSAPPRHKSAGMWRVSRTMSSRTRSASWSTRQGPPARSWVHRPTGRGVAPQRRGDRPRGDPLHDGGNRDRLGPIDGILGWGDLEPDYLTFLADAFVVPLVDHAAAGLIGDLDVGTPIEHERHGRSRDAGHGGYISAPRTPGHGRGVLLRSLHPIAAQPDLTRRRPLWRFTPTLPPRE